MHRTITTAGLLLALALGGCEQGAGSTGDAYSGDTYQWELPEGFPKPRVPDENSMSAAKVGLGRHLFYDRRISITETQSCADCHEQRRAFTDGKTVPFGVHGGAHVRNAMSLTNVAYNSVLNWANPNILTLEDQAFVVLFSEFPVELGWTDAEQTILERFRQDEAYRAMFTGAFPGEADPYTVDNVLKAVSAFERTLISGNSAYDRYNRGDKGALSDSAARGLNLFFSERLECFHCHAGFNFSETVDHDGTPFTNITFHNNGLYNIGGTGAYPMDNTGLWEFTLRDTDMGKFRPPTLRNIALTAPYMHDGSIATLESVIVDHYARGGRLIEEGEYAGDGSLNPYRSDLIAGFQITEQEVRDLLAFFDSLTDWAFVCNPAHGDPFGNIPMHEECSR